MKIAVIPDIHGRYDALVAMLKHCGAVDAQLAWNWTETKVIQLGDLIDRGPQVRECVELMMRLQQQAGGMVRVLKGNHEALLLESVTTGSGESLAMWLANGARGTLQSYGEDFDRLCRPGGSHFSWFKSLPVRLEEDGVLFVHGGLSKANVEAMEPERLMWDRPPLVRGPFQAVVSGHTPTASGRVEEKKGVFACDIGLGHRAEKALEYLVLETAEGKLKGWETKVVK
jgi:serine/threonine protein phosphatase 1